MYSRNYYSDKSELEIEESIKQEGFNPTKIIDGPGAEYQRHSHPETKVLAFLKGGMCVTVNEKHYNCEAGDRLVIPGNVPHSGKVWDDGCEFFWSEKIVNEN